MILLMPERLYPSIDQQYQKLVTDILTHGREKTDPQGVGNISLHGPTLTFDLSDGRYPLLGLRDLKGSRKAMAEELFWIMSGSTNVSDLHKEGVHLWDQWAEATKKDFPNYPDGDLGPVYGKQWRAFNGGGPKPVDQLTETMRLLKENPNSRRIVISVWNPYDINQVFITPCVRYLQFHHAQGHLGLTVVQGSADVPVGVPFDIAEYALFLRMAAQVNNMKPALLDYHLVDAHVYKNQIPAMEELLKREPTTSPQLNILSQPDDIFGFKRQDFELIGYTSHAKMDIPVAL
jgi:thymidylate synthase